MKLMNIMMVLSLVAMAAACNKKEEAQTPPPATEEVPAAEVMATPESEGMHSEEDVAVPAEGEGNN